MFHYKELVSFAQSKGFTGDDPKLAVKYMTEEMSVPGVVEDATFWPEAEQVNKEVHLWAATHEGYTAFHWTWEFESDQQASEALVKIKEDLDLN